MIPLERTPPFECLFCRTRDRSGFTRVEHAIPESLGNDDFVIPAGFVCDVCNHRDERLSVDSIFSHGKRATDSVRPGTRAIVRANGQLVHDGDEVGIVGRFQHVNHLVDHDVFQAFAWFLREIGVQSDAA
jgi:hypothetical protein